VIRHLVVPWPDRSLADQLGRPFRILAVSDDEDPSLEVAVNRDGIRPVDLVVGCGDLAPGYLGFVADALRAPVAYVRGNHDRGSAWVAGAGRSLPPAAPPSGLDGDRAAGLRIVGLGWPGVENEETQPSERGAWWQAVRAAFAQLRRRGPLLVISHVPPQGLGDMPGSNYHRGFAGYRWLVGRLRPALWLHGHVHPAAAEAIVVEAGTTPIINVTGATLIDLDPDADRVRPGSGVGRAASLEAGSEARP
jgi:uncharacterized protein